MGPFPDVASVNVCKELDRLVDFANTAYIWRIHKATGDAALMLRSETEPNLSSLVGQTMRNDFAFVSAPDLGFLIRKLPDWIEIDGVSRYTFRLEVTYDHQWWASYSHTNDIQTYADTPENAVAKLAIQLLKQGVIKKEEKEGI
jgi:hypothetical protein